MKKALIFNIQKFCTHDGPGIRTTIFFKGCPLSCRWCHNPESQSYSRELAVSGEKCTLCGSCVKKCPQQAVALAGETLRHQAENCTYCETCVDYCVSNAREVIGHEYSVGELLAEIEKDRPFYEQSGGGVTLSGGEVLVQTDFAVELAAACKQRGLNLAIDTCGYAPFESFDRVLANTDLFLYDLKIIDRELHRQYTGLDNTLILNNLRQLSAKGANINVRIPLIEGINTDEANIGDTISFLRDIPLTGINLLPYHDIGKGKYRKLNKPNPGDDFAPPSGERLDQIKARLERAGHKVKIGG